MAKSKGISNVVGRSYAPDDSEEAPRVELTTLGQRVSDEWWGIPNYYPQIEIKALQIMPDHLHGIIFIKEKMEKDLSRVIRGFKTALRLCQSLMASSSMPAPRVAC